MWTTNRWSKPDSRLLTSIKVVTLPARILSASDGEGNAAIVSNGPLVGKRDERHLLDKGSGIDDGEADQDLGGRPVEEPAGRTSGATGAVSERLKEQISLINGKNEARGESTKTRMDVGSNS
jgi:hypothetical protein